MLISSASRNIIFWDFFFLALIDSFTGLKRIERDTTKIDIRELSSFDGDLRLNHWQRWNNEELDFCIKECHSTSRVRSRRTYEHLLKCQDATRRIMSGESTSNLKLVNVGRDGPGKRNDRVERRSIQFVTVCFSFLCVTRYTTVNEFDSQLYK